MDTALFCNLSHCRKLFLGFSLNQHDIGRNALVPIASTEFREVFEMLWTIVAILLVLWLLGLVSSYTLGGFIHALLVIAIVLAIVSLVRPRAVV